MLSELDVLLSSIPVPPPLYHLPREFPTATDLTQAVSNGVSEITNLAEPNSKAEPFPTAPSEAPAAFLQIMGSLPHHHLSASHGTSSPPPTVDPS